MNREEYVLAAFLGYIAIGVVVAMYDLLTGRRVDERTSRDIVSSFIFLVFFWILRLIDFLHEKIIGKRG